MKKSKKLKIIFGILTIVIIVVCIIIQLIIKQEDKKLNEESKKYESLIVETKSGKKIETEYTHFDNEKFYIKIPVDFKQLNYDEIIKKYSGNIPKIVFSNDETTINIAISITDDQMSDDRIKGYREYMVNLLKGNSEIIESSDKIVDNHTVGNIKLISKASDIDIYNNMIFFAYKDKLVIINFNLTLDEKDEWNEVADFVIDSLFFKE